MSREERKMKQQMDLFKKMEVMKMAKDERASGRTRERAVAQSCDEPVVGSKGAGMTATGGQSSRGSTCARKSTGADEGEGSGEAEERDRRGPRRWEDAVPRREARSDLSREERKMRQQMELIEKMTVLKREREERAREREEADAKRGDAKESSSEEESSEDEIVTQDTPKPRHELEVFILVKHGKQVIWKSERWWEGG